MRKEFPGHYTPSNEEFEKIWKEGIIIFDTNVLLDFYRYSDETVTVLFEIMENIKDRIWIPYQLSKEYHKNLTGVISGQIKKYSDSIKTLQEFRKQINEKRNHPFLVKELHTEINDFCSKFDKELEEKRVNFRKIIKSNPSKEKIADILEGKLGTVFTDDKLE